MNETKEKVPTVHRLARFSGSARGSSAFILFGFSMGLKKTGLGGRGVGEGGVATLNMSPSVRYHFQKRL